MKLKLTTMKEMSKSAATDLELVKAIQSEDRFVSEKAFNKLYKKYHDSMLFHFKKFIKDEQKLFTVGYEGQLIESFINLLLKENVRVLCDIRKNPLSRKFGFSKGRLSKICKTVGIKYVHIPDLGIESGKRASLTSVADYNVLFDEYENSLTGRSEFLREVYALLKDEGRVALMCYEKKASMCHRHVVRDYLIRNHKVESRDL